MQEQQIIHIPLYEMNSQYVHVIRAEGLLGAEKHVLIVIFVALNCERLFSFAVSDEEVISRLKLQLSDIK